MRVLLVYQYFGPYHLARWRHLVRRLPERGMEPVGLQLFSRPDLYNWSEAGAEGIVRLDLPTNGRDNVRASDVPRLLSAIAELRPDVLFVNGWGMRDAVATHVWAQWRKLPRVLVTDSQIVDHRRSAWKERVKHAIIGAPACAFVAGATSRRYAERLGIPRGRIVEGCDVVDNAHFAPAAALRGPKRHRLLTVIRLAATKNLLAAGESFIRFAEGRSEPWTWSIAGYGPLEAEMRRLAERSGGRIRLLGGRAYAELPQVFADADVYWQPSLSEPWGLAVNEAMAAALPVLVSNRCGCHEDLVTAETGWTFDPTGISAMIEALERVAAARGRWETMGRAAAGEIDRWGLDRFSDSVYRAASLAASGPR